MKITHSNPSTIAQFSAMCIIGDNDVNKELRSIENPQHTEWQKNRVKDKPDKYRKISRILSELDDKINEYITDVLMAGSEESTDFEGAGDYLSDADVIEGALGSVADSDEPIEDKPSVTAPSRRKSKTYSGANKPGDESENADLGKEGNDYSGSEDLRGNDGKNNPNTNSEPKDSPEHKYDDGNNSYMKHIISNGMRFRCIKPSNTPNSYEIVFKSSGSFDNCDLNIYAIGDSNDKEKVSILSARVNGSDIVVNDGAITNMQIADGEIYKVSCIIDREDLFASKVEIYAN